MNKLITLILVCCFAFNLYAEQLPAKQFSHPERIRYDQHCFTIEGRDIFILSAAFHYFRVPQELWRDRFRKIKEAGFNTVETYVPWNWHERTMPRNVKDYSQCDFDDLKAWLKMAHEEFGLYTIVRPGPFICAEWAGGGYPRWVAKFCPAKYDTSFWLRSNHPEHMKWTKHWYDAVCPVFAEEQLTRKKSGEKGIIMVQLENEYIYFGMESEKKEEVLRDMAAYCTNNGIEVPLFTCVTPEVRGSKDAVISQLFDMDNQYVWWNIQEAKSRIEDLKRQQPNAPAFVCELQGGWFSTVGGGLSEACIVRDLLTRIPACLRKLVLLQPDLIVPIQFCKKSDHLRISKRPRLTLEIADIFNFQPDFLHHFATDGLFKCLPDLDKSSDQRISTVSTVVDAVARHKKFVPVRDRHDDCRGDLWIFRLAADRADERPLDLAVLRLCPTAPAELTALSPAPQLYRRDRCKCLVHRLHRTDVGRRFPCIVKLFQLFFCPFQGTRIRLPSFHIIFVRNRHLTSPFF